MEKMFFTDLIFLNGLLTDMADNLDVDVGDVSVFISSAHVYEKSIVDLKPEWGFKCLPSGNENGEYMFVGLNPSHTIGYNGYRCWSNPKDGSSRILLPLLEEIGIIKSCYFTNIVKNVTKDNSLPTEEMFLFWKDCFEDEIKKVNPFIILAMGTDTYSKMREFGIDCEKIWHPAYMFRGGNREDYKKQILKALKI